MKKITLLLVTCFSCSFVFGQAAQTTVRYPVKGKQVSIQVDEATVSVEGYNGDDLIIERDADYPPLKTEVPGYNLLTSGITGGDDFVHPGEIRNEPNLFFVRLRMVYNAGLNYRHWHILVPKNTHLKVAFVLSQLDAKMTFKNLSNELEVEGTAPIMEFSNISGPLTLSEGVTNHRIGGTKKIILSHLQIPQKQDSANEDRPFLNILTSYGDVDISLPGTLASTIQVDAGNGSVYTDLNMMQQRTFPMVKNRYIGNLNGGGRMIVVNSTYGNVYLRNEK